MKDGDGVELRASINVIDTIIESTLEQIEEELDYSYTSLYYIEELIPKELGALIEHLRTLPTIEEPELEEGGSSSFSEDQTGG